MDEKKRMTDPTWAARTVAEQWPRYWALMRNLNQSTQAPQRPPTETLRTFLVNDSVCSVCNSDQSMYEVVSRTFSPDRTVDYHQSTTICTVCDFGEDD